MRRVRRPPADPRPAPSDAASSQLLSRAAGYRLALDDYVVLDARPRLLELADCIKVDFRGVPAHERRTLTAGLRRPGRLLVAEKVEDLAEFAAAAWAQGICPARP